ncbi:MAG: flagellar basal body P-ring formation chaperone FlgA [Halioglobus sp.]
MTNFWRFTQCRLAAMTAVLPFLTVGAAASPANSSENQPAHSIESAAVKAAQERARAHGYEQVSVEVRKLDPRLRLRRCPSPLDTAISPASQVLGAVSVAIACRGEQPWTIYVRSHVVAQQTVPVLNKPLARNDIITGDDLKLITRPVDSSTAGLVIDPDQLVGMQLRRALDGGSILRLANLRKPDVIKRGQQVTVVSGIRGLQVRIQGKALGDAADGERVAVSNLSSGKRIEGVAHSDGTVSVQ